MHGIFYNVILLMNIKVTTIKEDILMLDMEQWAGFEGRIWREEVKRS